MKKPKPTIERMCKDCRHYNETATWDECRRYPPVAIVDDGDVVFVFPRSSQMNGAANGRQN